MDKIGNFLDSVSSFFTSGDKFPWSDQDDILECERELEQAAGSEELEKEKKLRYTCALVLSQQTNDLQDGITILEEESGSFTDIDPKKLFLLAVGYYRNKDWSKIREVLDLIDPPSTSSDMEEIEKTSVSQYLGNYEEIEPLGEGGFGQVKICKHKWDGHNYAVKIIQLEYEEEINKIVREVRTLSTLQHKHVVRYFQSWLEMESPVLNFQSNTNEAEIGYFSESNRSDTSEKEKLQSSFFFIQMELCTRTLGRFLEDQKHFDETVALRLSCQIIDGLAYIHKMAVIHRDINPKNIFLDSENNIKIGDFGLAMFELEAGDVTGGSEIDVGTSFYKAPESAELSIDQKMDMFSVGIVIFEIWHPFGSGMERVKVLGDLVKGNPPSQWTEKHPLIASLVTRLLGVSEERPSATEVQTELRAM